MRTFDACVRSADADCVYDVLAETEKQAGLSREGFRRFFHDVYAPRMAGYRPAEFRVEPGMDADVQMAGDRAYRKASGEVVYIGASGSRTEAAAKVEAGVGTLLLGIFQTYKSSDHAGASLTRSAHSESTSALWLRALEDLRPDLERAGLKGAFLKQGVEGRFVTWEAWIEELRERQKKAVASNHVSLSTG